MGICCYWRGRSASRYTARGRYACSGIFIWEQYISGTYAEKFPGYKISPDRWTDRSQLLTSTQLDTLKNVLEAVHIQSEDFSQEQPFVAGLLEQSNNSIGHLQAMQHGNALIAANVKQLVKLRQLIMSQINADVVYRSAEITRRAESEAKGVAWASAAPRTLYQSQFEISFF